MTPKEKAIQLVDKFRLNVLDYESSGLNLFKSKQCALIAVDEILKAVQSLNRHHTEYIRDEKIPYWQEVKTEIEKL
jgi:hypothetical protein